MLVKISILSPFRYEYNGRASWVATGESLHLDTGNKDQRAQLFYILSSNFPFKEFIHVDVKALPLDIQCEIEGNKGFYSLPITPIEVVKDVEPTEFFQPLGEAEDNRFIKPIIFELIKDKKEDLIETSLEDCLEDTQELKIDVCPKIEEAKQKRKEELMMTPWLKVKQLAEDYGIVYTNKAETSQLIIDKEFS